MSFENISEIKFQSIYDNFWDWTFEMQYFSGQISHRLLVTKLKIPLCIFSATPEENFSFFNLENF